MMHMRRVAITADAPGARTLVGGLLCADARHPERTREVLLRKGRTLTHADLDRLAVAGPVPLVVLLPQGELEEDAAAARLGVALAGPGVAVSSPHQGMVVLRAARRGFFRVDRTVLTAANEHAGVLAFAAADARAADTGVTIGSVKVAPLLLPEDTVRSVEALGAEQGPAFTVGEIPSRQVALVGTTRLSPTARRRAEESLAERIGWYGSTLSAEWTSPRVDALLPAFAHARAQADLVLIASAATMDPGDILFEALREAGGGVERIGVPIEPGTACWVGRLDALTVFGLASCELFGSPGAFDILLPRLLLGEHPDTSLLASLATGGLLLDGPPLVPAYAPPEPAHATATRP